MTLDEAAVLLQELWATAGRDSVDPIAAARLEAPSLDACRATLVEFDGFPRYFRYRFIGGLWSDNPPVRLLPELPSLTELLPDGRRWFWEYDVHAGQGVGLLALRRAVARLAKS